MDRWTGKIAVVTGASAGIGAAVCKDLVRSGVIVIGLARRVDKIEDLKLALKPNGHNLFAYKCDVTKEESIKQAFEWIANEFGEVNILINNAGITKCTMILSDNNDDDLRDVINTNLNGLLFCTKAAYQLMKRNNCDGHIVNINSILGHGVPMIGQAPISNIYAGTKHAVTATTEVIRQELIFLNNEKVKISSISPGLVKTDIIEVAGYANVDTIFEKTPHLLAEDVSQAILYVLSTPANVQVHELIIKPVGERG